MGWKRLTDIFRAVRLTGPFVTMIYSMITGDMLTFGIIYSIVLFGFSQSFYFLYKGFPGVKSTLYETYATTWMALFQITLGNYDYQELSSTTYPGISKTVFALFMVFVPILLLNMLIAMMGNTYAHVIEQSEKEWMKQWAKIVIALERAIPQADAHHYLQEYSISLGPSEIPGTEQRGVMVIKSKNKTRAKQRKGAVANWKRVGKVTINALKKKGLTGEEMRNLMWGRESINTPIKLKNTKQAVKSNRAANLGAFGEALSSALDVMAFTNDLNIDGGTVMLNMPNDVKASPIQLEQQVKNNKNFGSNAFQTTGAPIMQPFDQLQGLKIPSEKLTNKTIPEIKCNAVISQKNLDPLRLLVIYSEDPNCDPEILKQLAHAAANLKGIEKISTKREAGVKALAGIFAGTEEFVKKVEHTMKKSYSILDPSDSDGLGGTKILGQISRSRRAKSANKRLSAKLKEDKQKLVNSSDSSSVDTLNIEDSKLLVDYAEDKINISGESTEHIESAGVALNEEPSCTVVCETGLIQELGEGHPSQSGNVASIKKKRPKTGVKHNKVTPVDARTPKSACEKLNSDRSESPDPLEPWSTRKIANMNKILAWENEHDSM